MKRAFTYEVRVDGKWVRQVDSPPPSRADMSYWGMSLNDIRAPHGFRLGLDEQGEPVFRPGRRMTPEERTAAAKLAWRNSRS